MQEIRTEPNDRVIAKFMNSATYRNTYNRLKLLAVSMFEWINLPESTDARFLEKVLYENGRAIFVKDDTMGFLNLRVTICGALNVYELPIKYNAWSLNYNKQYDANNCVIIRNNLLELSTDEFIVMYAKRIADIQRTLDVNLNTQKYPFIIKCTEQQRLTMKTVFSKFDGNEPLIIADKNNLNLDGFAVLETKAPYNLDKLYDYKKDMENDFLSFLGINNANTDKKERLISDEVNANNENIELSVQSMLLTRKEACKNINKMFGLNIDVKLRKPTEIIEDLQENETQGEVLENE